MDFLWENFRFTRRLAEGRPAKALLDSYYYFASSGLPLKRNSSYYLCFSDWKSSYRFLWVNTVFLTFDGILESFILLGAASF